ncbi:unnamed protein product [[Actinomadura] parvosata subsp. kistnae]|uniref:hypothetical protein n=1 Tax=[Actinomadura] parvosata TaxID=1955412 RepID=UPI000D277784|nr:unnamed protein product [Actinomadura parvosata subsp. kistnae]
MSLTTADNGDGAGEFRLIVRDGIARLLAYEVRPRGQARPSLQVTYGDLGWADGLGERPRN